MVGRSRPGRILRALIVDDEPVARSGLRAMLAHEPRVEIVGEAASGEAAIRLIHAARQDLVFLDVQLPDLDGFGVLSGAGPIPFAVIFVTAFEQYALPAFEANAVDYLLKPFNRQRLTRAVRRASAFLGVTTSVAGSVTDPASSAPSRMMAWREAGRRFVVPDGNHLHFLEPERVDWIESWGNYVRLFAHGRPHLLRETVRGVEARLDPSQFLRISRSVIVNVERVRSLRPRSNGQVEVVLTSGAVLRCSRRYRARLRLFFAASRG